MTVKQLAENLGFMIYTDTNSNDIKGVYCCDLLSNALVKLNDGYVWLTVMNNVNVSAVAYSKNASCILLTEGVVPDKQMLEKANEHSVSVLGTMLDTYEAATLIGTKILQDQKR